MERSSRVRRLGFTIIELLVAMGVTGVLLGIVSTALLSIQKSVAATNHYILGVNNSNRLLDYVGSDLTRAVRVGQLVGGSNTTFKNQLDFLVSDTNTLTVNIPDYYASNTPDNVLGSTYKTSRNSRATLGPFGYVNWKDAVTTSKGALTPRYTPSTSPSDEIQVRY